MHAKTHQQMCKKELWQHVGFQVLPLRLYALLFLLLSFFFLFFLFVFSCYVNSYIHAPQKIKNKKCKVLRLSTRAWFCLFSRNETKITNKVACEFLFSSWENFEEVKKFTWRGDGTASFTTNLQNSISETIDDDCWSWWCLFRRIEQKKVDRKSVV